MVLCALLTCMRLLFTSVVYGSRQWVWMYHCCVETQISLSKHQLTLSPMSKAELMHLNHSNNNILQYTTSKNNIFQYTGIASLICMHCCWRVSTSFLQSSVGMTFMQKLWSHCWCVQCRPATLCWWSHSSTTNSRGGFWRYSNLWITSNFWITE